MGILFNRNKKLGFETDYKKGTVVFYNAEKRIKRTIINHHRICDFPGIANEELIMPYYKEGSKIPPIAQYGYSCECYDQEKPQFVVYWMIQPDGRYYADEDGYGAEQQSEIELYAFLDDEGRFEGAFRIRSIGNTMFMGTDLEEQRKKELESQQGERDDLTPEQLFETYRDKYVPEILKYMLEQREEWGRRWSVSCKIPGTEFKSRFELSLTDRYHLSLGVHRIYEDRMISNYIFAGEKEELIHWLEQGDAVNKICETVQRLMKKA